MSNTPQNQNRGTLNKNKNRANPKAPEYRGSCTIEGKKWSISAWVQESKDNGEKYFSMSFQPWVDKGAAAPSPTPAPQAQKQYKASPYPQPQASDDDDCPM